MNEFFSNMFIVYSVQNWRSPVTMIYDDVDVNILDSKDAFGIFKMPESRIPTEEDKKPNKSPFKRDSEFKTPKYTRRKPDEDESQFKFARKKEDDVEPYSEIKLKFARKNDDSEFESKYSKSTRKKLDDDEPKPRKRLDDEEKPAKIEICTDFKYKTAVTFQEKLSVLEERDKYLRATAVKNVNKNMSVIVNGTCPDMCPEKERLLREINCSFSIFEGQIVDNEMHVVPEYLVKEYSRSSADQDEPLPHELRPEPVLIDTMNHILINIIPKIEQNIDITEWYHFCWDRLRSLRKDIIQQQLCSPKIVQILEQSARFHICCGDLLFGADPKIFDEKINAENLVNCLQMLISMYEDLEKIGVKCANESEFRVYMMLLLLDSGDIPDVIRWNDEDSKQYAGQAKEIFFAFKHNFYTRFFKLVKKTSYLNACILQRYFSTVKTQILNVLVNSYSSGSQTSKFPLTFIRKILEFDTDEETIAFIESHGFVVNYETNEVRGSKSSFTVPEVKVTCGSSYILRNKRLPILQAVTNVAGYSPKITLGKTHSSFDKFDRLTEDAWTAEDQRQKVISMFGDIYSQIKTDTPNTPLPPKQISPKPMIFEEPMHIVNDMPEQDLAPKNVFTFSFKKPELVEPLIKSPPPFTFSKPVSSPIPPPSPAPPQSPVLSSPKLKSPRESELYDPEEATSSADECDQMDTISEPTITRDSEDLVNSLTSALSQFESLYSHFFAANREQNEKIRKMEVARENRRLRKTVKKLLKRNNARKYARIWKKKVEFVRQRRENFVDIVHLPLTEYLSLWGTLVERDQLPRSIVADTKDTHMAVRWSSNILNDKCLGVNYVGDKMADIMVQNVRLKCAKLKLKMKTYLCSKVVLSLPTPNTESFYSFVSKVSELCRALFYKEKELGCVETLVKQGVKVCYSVDVKTGSLDPYADLPGVTNLIVYVCEKQESLDEILDRLAAVEYAYPLFVHVITSNNHHNERITRYLNALKKRKIISAWEYVKWDNFFTIPKAVLNGAKFIPWTPYFQVKSITSFVEAISGDFFLSLCYIWNCSLPNTPITYINLYNDFLSRIKDALSTESLRKYNLAPEFVPSIIGVEDSSNTLTDPQLISLLSKYALVGFTKWPPKSVPKMVKLLTKYCNAIDDDSTLIPNILRLVSPKDDLDVETISKTAPWIKVTELWCKYNVYATLKREPEMESVFVIYDECKIKEISDGIWIYNSV